MKGYIKVYKGPFTKKQAIGIARELREKGIGKIGVRARSSIKNEYDIYAKINYDKLKEEVKNMQQFG